MITMQEQPAQIAEMMMANDSFSQWLGIKLIDIAPGYCHLQMQVTAEMCNGFHIAHGGIAFSLADSCCSFAVNAHGRKAVSVETSINQFKAIQAEDVLTCRCKEESLGKKLATFTAEIVNQDEQQMALFKGTYYRSEKRWIEPPEEGAQPAG